MKNSDLYLLAYTKVIFVQLLVLKPSFQQSPILIKITWLNTLQDNTLVEEIFNS